MPRRWPDGSHTRWLLFPAAVAALGEKKQANSCLPRTTTLPVNQSRRFAAVMDSAMDLLLSSSGRSPHRFHPWLLERADRRRCSSLLATTFLVGGHRPLPAAEACKSSSPMLPIGQPSRVRCPIGRHRGEGEPGGAPRGAGEPWLARRGLDTAAIDGPLVLGAAYASTPTALLCFLRSRWRQGGLVVAWGGFPHLRSVGQQEKRWCGHKCTSSTAETPDSGQFHDGSADLSQGILFRPVILNRYIHHRRRHASLSPALDWLDPSRHPTHPPALPPRTSII